MALPDSVLYVEGTQISFADHAGDFGPTAANVIERGTPTDVQLSLASVANDAARQSAKVDLGANRPPAFAVWAAIEFAASPVAGQPVEFYWAGSPSGTAGTGNPAGVSGSDAAYSGYSSNLNASVVQLEYIGTMIVTAQATTTVQIAYVGLLVPKHRYGSLVVYNKADIAIHSDDVECNVIAEPLRPQIQD